MNLNNSFDLNNSNISFDNNNDKIRTQNTVVSSLVMVTIMFLAKKECIKGGAINGHSLGNLVLLLGISYCAKPSMKDLTQLFQTVPGITDKNSS